MKKIEEKIKEILEIVKLCPPNLQEKCFEILLNKALGTQKEDNLEHAPEHKSDDLPNPPAATGDEIKLSDIHTKARKLLDKGITIEQVNNIFYKEGDEFKPLFDDLKSTKVSESQIRLSLLEAFKNAIKTGNFSFSLDTIKELCDLYKCYDTANFSANFKSNHKLFMEDYKRGSTMSLPPQGKDKLIEVVKEIAS